MTRPDDSPGAGAVRSAAILVAGGGTRLGAVTDEPKSLLAIGGTSLLRRHLDHLGAVGITDVVLVVGYRHELVRRHLEGFDGPARVRLVENEDYRRLGNGYSLWLGLQHVTGPCLLMDGDVIYERAVLERFLAGGPADSLLVGAGDLGDIESTKTIVDGDDRIVKLVDKRPADEHEAPGFLGEAIGVLMFTEPGRQALLADCERFFGDEANLLLNWEHLLNLHLRDHALSARYQDDGRWIEIDTPEDLAAARRLFEEDPTRS